MRTLWALGFLLVGCGGVVATGDGGATEAASGSPPPRACMCPAGQGCLRPVVTRTASATMLPWTVWPMEADGRGTLVVSAARGTVSVARVAVQSADFSPANVRFDVDLGCVPAEPFTVRAFLDDNGNARETDLFSSDYRDTCAMMRSPTFTVTEGMTLAPELVLANSCD